MDDQLIRDAITRQFDAAFAMMKAAMEQCPADVWADDSKGPAGWKLAYHTLFFTDVYLGESFDEYEQPAWADDWAFLFEGKISREPYEVELPDVVYDVAQLTAFCEEVNANARRVIAEKPLDDQAPSPHVEGTRLDMHVYNLRHLQHHVGQLTLLTRRGGGGVVGWSRNGETPKKPG